jgi:hypothetical protein
MTGCLPLAVPIQNQPDGLLPGCRQMPARFWSGDIFSLADLAFVYLAADDGSSILDLLLGSLTVRTLFHGPFISCLFY